MSCCSSTSMGLSLEVSGATCEALVALPRAGIGSTDLVPPAGLMSTGGLASVVPAVSVHRDFWPPPFGRLVCPFSCGAFLLGPAISSRGPRSLDLGQ